eukprot:1469551-Rhodomonas_salina.1
MRFLVFDLGVYHDVTGRSLASQAGSSSLRVRVTRRPSCLLPPPAPEPLSAPDSEPECPLSLRFDPRRSGSPGRHSSQVRVRGTVTRDSGLPRLQLEVLRLGA